MKKNSFMEGAMIATISIIFIKIVGILYVIPFFSIIGIKGSILYGYAYSIYAIFLTLSLGGIPIAISKIVSEYNALGYYYTKEKAFKIGSAIILGMGVVSFILLFSFAPNIASLILGDLKGGNTIEDVTYVIRIVSSALLIVPLASVTKGYLQGHKYIAPSSIANIIEQIVRVLIIIFGSYLALNVFGLSTKNAVGISVFGATLGAIFSFLYLSRKVKKNKDSLYKDIEITREESRISTKQLIKKIVFYALPFILLDMMKAGYNMVDTLTVVSTMVELGFSDIAEITVGVLTNWGSKLNMIVISISLGIAISLIPNISSSFVKGNFKDISVKINQTLQMILFTGLPMTIGLAFLARPIWVIFYTYEPTSILIFQQFIFQALTFSIFSILVTTFQTMNNSKVAFGTLFLALVTKATLNIPLMKLFTTLNIPPYYAPNILTLVVHTTAIIFMIRVLMKNYELKLALFKSNYIRIFLTSMAMYVVLLITNLFIPLDAVSKLPALIEVMIFSAIGVGAYLFISIRNNLVYDVIGHKLINKILIKLRIRKEVN